MRPRWHPGTRTSNTSLCLHRPHASSTAPKLQSSKAPCLHAYTLASRPQSSRAPSTVLHLQRTSGGLSLQYFTVTILTTQLLELSTALPSRLHAFSSPPYLHTSIHQTLHVATPTRFPASIATQPPYHTSLYLYRASGSPYLPVAMPATNLQRSIPPYPHVATRAARL